MTDRAGIGSEAGSPSPEEVPSSAPVTADAAGGSNSGRSKRADYSRALSKMPASIRLCLALVVILVTWAAFAPWLTPHDPDAIHLFSGLRPPVGMEGYESGYLLGTDQLGRDILSRCIYGMRVSIGIAMLGTILGCIVGSILGLLSGIMGGVCDRLVMMMVDVQLAIPYLLIVLVGIVMFGTDIPVLVALVGLAGWETYARLVRGQVLSVREMPFIEASRALGASKLRIAIRHVLPNVASPLIVLVTLTFPLILLLESSLSFLGIGVQPPTSSLGRMVGEGRDNMMLAWWVVAGPAALILVITLIVQLIGDWLRDVIDVRLR